MEGGVEINGMRGGGGGLENLIAGLGWRTF